MLRKTIIASLVTAGAVATAIVVRSLLNDTLKQAEEEDEEINFISISEETPDDSEDEEELPKAEEVAPEIKEIAALYPYLKPEFISEQFGRNDVFNREYPEDTLITISHKAKFDDTQTMNSFVKIGEDNGYGSEILNETEVKISRKMFTEDGAILSDIFNVANQVSCLKGVYEGYNIEL